MEFIKKLFSKTSETFRKLIKKFPVTLAIIVFATIFMTIDINQDVQIFDKIMLFSTVFAVEAFFTEVCIYEKKSFRIIGYLASTLIAIGFTVLVLGGVTIYKDTISRILAGYLIILFMFAIYKIIKENGVSFQEYLLKVFANMFNSTINYLVQKYKLDPKKTVMIGDRPLDIEAGRAAGIATIFFDSQQEYPQATRSIKKLSDIME